MLTLHITDEYGRELDYPVKEEDGFLLTMGRSPECDIAVPEDSHLSRIHCNIGYWGGELIIRDCGSSNGIYRGNERIEQATLLPGLLYYAGGCSISCDHSEGVPPLPDEPGKAAAPEPVPAPEPTPAPEPKHAPASKPTSRRVSRRKAAAPEARPTGRRPRAAEPQVNTASGLVGRESRPGSELGLPMDFPLAMRLATASGSSSETRLQFGLRAEADCYLWLVQYDCSGEACIIFPYGRQTGRPHLYHGIEGLFPPPGRAAYDFVVEAPFGQDTIIALACTQSVELVPLLQAALPRHGSVPGQAEAVAISRATVPAGAQWASCVLTIDTTPGT